MCLYLKNECATPSIADKDIIVYKVGYPAIEYRFFNLIKIHCFHPYCFKSFTYYKNKRTSKVTIEVCKYDNSVSSGYHAWINLHKAKHKNTIHPSMVIGKFKIPKGSEYYLGDDDDIVPNQIIYLGLYGQ